MTQHRADCPGPWGHLRMLAFTLSEIGAFGTAGQSDLTSVMNEWMNVIHKYQVLTSNLSADITDPELKEAYEPSECDLIWK